ncbi:zinc finger protein 37 homolog [Microplitis demolitor]|uniref:zinc finger protein 37 homolog n=1 Tax=Microplitis demolitor TaxID=69319 RepID=UPI00235B5FF1|nr:zinc finger protein 37 homolog [Microplitis demolitor]
MSVIEIIEISSGEDDDGASTIMNMPLGKTDDIDVQQYSDRRITKTQPQYKDANNPEIIDSQYLINKLINSNAKIINSLMEQNQLLSFTNDSISQGNDEYLKLYATRYENNIMDSLSRIKIVKIESLNVQENLTADIIDSYDDNDVQEVIPDSNRQNSSNGNTNQLNLKNIEETTNDICHRESSTVIETPIDNEFPLFKRKDLKEISNSKHQTEKISKSSLKKFNKCLPMVELDRISVSENNIISLSNAENDIIFVNNEENIIISSSNAKNTIFSSNVENNILSLNNAENDIISVSNKESNIISLRNTENVIISSSNVENTVISSSNAENDNYCRECNRFFASTKKFVYHKRYRHNGRKCYKCEKCDYASNEKSHFIRHKTTHTSEGPYQCFCCSFTFMYKNALKSHLFTHIDKNLSCDICHEKFEKANLLINHIIYYHSISPSVRTRQCKVCQELLPDRYSLKIHIETHKIGSLFKCNTCCYKATSSQNLEAHVKNHISNKIICDDCGRSIANKNKFKRHWYRMHNFFKKSRVYKCTHCHNRITYVRYDHFIRHIINIHGIEYLEQDKI